MFSTILLLERLSVKEFAESAERCATFAWDLQKFDVLIPKAINMRMLEMA